MKTQNLNTKLAFNKSSVLELNNAELFEVNGGTTPVCAYVAGAAGASSPGCVAAGYAAAGAAVGGFLAWIIN